MGNRNLQILIPELLERDFPLAVSDIRRKLTRGSQQLFSTQAIHKTLNRLIEGNIVTRINKRYQLSHAYIFRLEEKVRRLKQAYILKRAESYALPEGTKHEFKVASLAELDKLCNDILFEKLQALEKPADYLQHVPHAWFSLVQMSEEIRVTDQILEHCKGFYTLVNGSSPLDLWLKKFYSGPKLFYAVKPKPVQRERYHQYAVIGNYVIEAWYPKETGRRLSNVFRSATRISMLDIPELLSLANTPTSITLTLLHNHKKAQKIRAALLKEFSDVK